MRGAVGRALMRYRGAREPAPELVFGISRFHCTGALHERFTGEPQVGYAGNFHRNI